MDLLQPEARRVWIPNHPEAGYLPGRVEETRDDGTLLVIDDNGHQFNVDQAEAQSVDPSCLLGVDDLLTLGDFNEAALLHNIRVRYGDDKIYTGIGSPILISVNPYQNIPGLYGAETQKLYRNSCRAPGQNGGPPVHLYSVADAAYKTMLHQKVNQSIIISGESGAGKTEATKRMLAYLAEMQRNAFRRCSGNDSARRTVEQQVLDANPVLEAFGNAKTVRNDNSSRFGKFIEVEFDATGKLLSAQISNYLLEKCRIVTQQPDERNYHIFYQLCASGGPPGLSESLKLADVKHFDYINTCENIDMVDDKAEFAQVLDCMTSLGFTTAERVAVFRAVAAVLHLGSLRFATSTKEGQDGVCIETGSEVELISELLGLTAENLLKALEYKTLEDPLTKKTIHMPHNLQSATNTGHSIAKVVYTKLFDWLVWRINQSIAMDDCNKREFRSIGLLDIYGFEVFEWNSFEQLCINFANEKLQQHFNAHMFNQEQQLYTVEGIQWNHIRWQDNSHIIDSLAKRPLGLFCLVDSQCITPKATDETLYATILKTFQNSQVVYKPGKFAGTDFAVAHYAGDVVYSVETFLEKNQDNLHADIMNLLKASKSELVNQIFNDPRFVTDQKQVGTTQRTQRRRSTNATEPDQRRERQNVTVGMMFREQLDKLVEDLNKTNPRYVRCIKPNSEKKPGLFDSIDVLRQLRCAGMLESIRIRRAGYAVRRPFMDFFTRFRILVPMLTACGADPDYRELSRRLATEVEQRLRREGVMLEERPWQVGQSKFFMKEELERHFERLIVERSKGHVIMLQRRRRGCAQRNKFIRVRAAAIEVQAALRTRAAVMEYREAKQRNAACIEIQSFFRAAVARNAFMLRRRAAVTVQRIIRGWRLRSRIGKIKNKAAADKLRRFREEEAHIASLEKAKLEAREREREVEEMRRELAETQMRLTQAESTPPSHSPRTEHLQAGPSLAEESVMSPSREAALKGELETLRHAYANLEDDLRKRSADQLEATQKAENMSREVKTLRLEAARGGAGGGSSMFTNAAPIDSLRAEILARLPQCSPGPETAFPLSSGLRRIVDDEVADVTNMPNDGERNTIVNQRENLERFRQQFQKSQENVKSDVTDNRLSTSHDATSEELQTLRDEVRRLRRENASIRTKQISAQEEDFEKKTEIEGLLEKVSAMRAEMEDSQLRQRAETGGLSQQLQDTMATLRQQTEDMMRMNARTIEAELQATSSSAKANRLEVEFAALQEQVHDSERSLESLQQDLTFAQRGSADLKRRHEVIEPELETLRSTCSQQHMDLKAKENEVSNIQRVLDDVMRAHVPMEEVQRWKQRAESYEQQYQNAARKNEEMETTVGHMAQTVGERSNVLEELRAQNTGLLENQAKKNQEIKMNELEKQDLRKENETLQLSCNYFQNKYKSTQNDLRNIQREHAATAEGLKKARALIAERVQENESLRGQALTVGQQLAESHSKRNNELRRVALIRETFAVVLPILSNSDVKNEDNEAENVTLQGNDRAKMHSALRKLQALLAEGERKEDASNLKRYEDGGAAALAQKGCATPAHQQRTGHGVQNGTSPYPAHMQRETPRPEFRPQHQQRQQHAPGLDHSTARVRLDHTMAQAQNLDQTVARMQNLDQTMGREHVASHHHASQQPGNQFVGMRSPNFRGR